MQFTINFYLLITTQKKDIFAGFNFLAHERQKEEKNVKKLSFSFEVGKGVESKQ